MFTEQFFGSQYREVPEALSMRIETYTMVLIGILMLSFLLVALSRMRNGKAIGTVLLVFFKGASGEQLLKENMRLNSLSSILLVLNYFLSFSLCLFLFLNRILFVNGYWSSLISIIIPIGLFIIEIVGLIVAGWLTGETKRLETAVTHTFTGIQFIGLILSVLSLFWIMNPQFNRLFLGIFISLFCLKYLTRLLKNSIVVLANGVQWYYLILYFCTLEILPLFVAYYYVIKNFLE